MTRMVLTALFSFVLFFSSILPSGQAKAAPMAGPEDQPQAFELILDSTLGISGDGSVSSHHVRSRMPIDPLPGQSTAFAGWDPSTTST